MTNQHTLTKRLDDLEQRYDRFKGDLMIVFFTGVLGLVSLILSLIMPAPEVSFVFLILSAISYAVSISYKIIMINRVWRSKKWINK